MNGVIGPITMTAFLVAAAMIVIGGLLVRSARRQNGGVWGSAVCPGGGCRFRNKRGARFCARCGRPLD